MCPLAGWLGITLHLKSDWPVRCWRHSSNDTAVLRFAVLLWSALVCSGLPSSNLLCSISYALESD